MKRFVIAFTLLFCVATVSAQETRYEELANTPFPNGYPSQEDIVKLKDEIFFQRATQCYIWSLPYLTSMAMKEGVAKTFGDGYHVMPIWKDRLNAKTKITTPNSDVIYGLGFLDLKKDGPMIVEIPPGLQGIMDDFYQRPIGTENPIDGKTWSGDVGLPGPDKGKGGKYLILPPDRAPTLGEKIPDDYFVYRSRTYGVMLLMRGFFKDPKQLEEPVQNMEKIRVYPLGRKSSDKRLLRAICLRTHRS